MARVSTTLENIEYLKQQENEILISDKEKREIEKDYKSFLIATLKDEFYNYFEKSNDYKETFNDLIINDTKVQNNVLSIIEIESLSRFKEKNKIIELDNDNWKSIKEKVYFWEYFDFENDISDNYIKVLKQVYQSYSLKHKINESNIINMLKNYFINLYNKYDYYAVNEILYQKETIQDFINDYCSDEKETKIIYNNYYLILNKIDNIYKKTNNQPIKTKNHNKSILLGGVLYGLYKGLKNACK